MEQTNFGPIKTICIFLLFVSMLAFQPGFAWADEWEDAGFAKGEAQGWKDAGFTKDEAVMWKHDGFTPKEAMARRPPRFRSMSDKERETSKVAEESQSAWTNAGFTKNEAEVWKAKFPFGVAAILKNGFLFSTPYEVEQFTTKYCKKGFSTYVLKEDNVALASRLSGEQLILASLGTIKSPSKNYNDDDGAHCYMFQGETFQLLGDNEALYKNHGLFGEDGIFYVSFGKRGRAVSSILSLVSVKGSYKYQSLAGMQIVPELRILKMAK